MTLFEMVADDKVFSRVLQVFFDGEYDRATANLLQPDFNISVFNDTLRLCAENEDLANAISHSISLQSIVSNTDEIEKFDKRFPSTDVHLIDSQSYQAAYGLSGRTCVLNFANYFSPGGGGVRNGCTAQEECLCRTSTLYGCISCDSAMREFYGCHNDYADSLFTSDLIYTPDVKVFKTDDHRCKLLPRTQWYDVDVITCAAPDIRFCTISDDDLFALIYNRINRILEVSAAHRCDNLVLGAFGCGVFGNDPNIVADAFNKVISRFGGAFKIIIFAIPSPSSHNYKVFSRIIQSKERFYPAPTPHTPPGRLSSISTILSLAHTATRGNQK